jgi:NAD/NADP transhydrogenase beta subunit
MLEHSLKPGMNEATVQFGTIWKTRSALFNCSNTTAAELLEPVLVGGQKEFGSTLVECQWVGRGLTGEDICPNKAMSTKLLLEIQNCFELKLLRCRTNEAVLAVCLNAMFHTVLFVEGFRGEEMPIMMSLDAMTKGLAVQHSGVELARVMIALRGRVKGERKANACHLISIMAKTKLGLKPKLWLERAVEACCRLGITHG